MTLAIGLTGGIGSGKSTAAQCFAEYGIQIIDADAISRKLTAGPSAVMSAIANAFGPSFILENGALDRAKMRELISHHPHEKQRLESFIHPAVRQGIHVAIQSSTSDYTIVDIPLLTENYAQYAPTLKRIIVVEAPIKQRIERVKARSQLSEEQILAIMSMQATDEQRRQIANDILINDKNRDFLHQQVTKLHLNYLNTINHPTT